MLTIVHANDLLNGTYVLSLNELRLLALACSKVDSKGPNTASIRINVSEFKEVYGINYGQIYPELRQAVKGLMRKPVTIFDSSSNKVKELAWLSENEYETDDGSYVKLRFSNSIEPFLFELREKFTALNFEFASRLNTAFSFRLYQWLYQEKNTKRSKRNGAVEVTLDIRAMKERTGIKENSYERWGDFKDKVLSPAVERINANTDLSVIYRPIKTGRKTTHVRFSYIEEKATFAKPLRPRLRRRPKVLAGSRAEGDWMHENLTLLLNYEAQLKDYDPAAKMTLPDLRKMAQYASIGAPELKARIAEEIAQRTVENKQGKTEDEQVTIPDLEFT